MTRDEAIDIAKNYLSTYVAEVTTKSRYGKYICPICHSGEGPHGTGAFSINRGKKWKCFACDQAGDIFDLYGAVNGITNKADIFTGVFNYLGMTVDNAGIVSTPTKKIDRKVTQETAAEQDKTQRDFTAYYKQCITNLKRAEQAQLYLQGRGISMETSARFFVGFDSQSDMKGTGRTTPRLILPSNKNHYVGRRIDGVKEDKALNPKGAQIGLMNTGVLWQNKQEAVFICEGAFDAMSFFEVGADAVALNSTSNHNKLIKLLTEKPATRKLIICLDNDEAGEKAADKLLQGLKDTHTVIKRNVYGGNNDANEALMTDREAFKMEVGQAMAADFSLQDEPTLKEQETAAKLQAYKAEMNAAEHLQAFVNGIADSVNTPPIATGFKELDSVLDGGLYEGLYSIGALTSLGKTTFTMQLADQVAAAGTDVIIIALEMARNQLIAKSISRETLLETIATGGNMKNAKTSRGITSGVRYSGYNKEERELIEAAVKRYGQYAAHLYIKEGVGNISVNEVREIVKQHISLTGNKPLVVIDYLQILTPADMRASDKQNTDKAVLELKRISRDYKIPVIAISSLNRTSYSGEINMSAFKESGAIEYGSDVVIGLQFAGAGGSRFDEKRARAENPRQIELVVMKNRDGATGCKVNFEYFPMFNLFREMNVTAKPTRRVI